MFFIPIFVTSLNMLSFHLYALLDPDYGNEKDEERGSYLRWYLEETGLCSRNNLGCFDFWFPLPVSLSIIPIKKRNTWHWVSSIYFVGYLRCYWNDLLGIRYINDRENIIVHFVVTMANPWKHRKVKQFKNKSLTKMNKK